MQKLKQLREEIERVDALIIEKLAERQRLSKQIGQIKAQFGKDVLDTTREAQLMAYHQTVSEQYQLDAGFVRQLFEIILTYSRGLQQ